MQTLIWIYYIGVITLTLCVGYVVVSFLMFIGIPLDALLKLAGIAFIVFFGIGLIIATSK